VVSVAEKAELDSVRCGAGRRAWANRWWSVEIVWTMSKPGDVANPGGVRRVTWLLSGRHPAWRRRDPASGPCAERGNLSPQCEGRSPSGWSSQGGEYRSGAQGRSNP